MNIVNNLFLHLFIFIIHFIYVHMICACLSPIKFNDQVAYFDANFFAAFLFLFATSPLDVIFGASLKRIIAANNFLLCPVLNPNVIISSSFNNNNVFVSLKPANRNV